MRPDFIDRWSRLDSPVHRAPAAAKAALALLTVLAVVLVPLRHPAFFGAVALGLVAVAIASRVPPRFLLGRLLRLEPLVAGVAVLALLQPGGAAAAASIVVRSTLCLSTMLLLTSTTPFASLVDLMKRAGVPALIVTVVALLYRYLFVLADEAGRMGRARRSRTFAGGRARAWRDAAGLAAELFVRSTGRAERIHAAMCARGWR